MKFYITILLTAFAVLGMPSKQVQAFDMCYHPEEAEAEQAIRIHSELMVIGLNCQHMGMRAGKNLYGMYRTFTAEHADIFGGYEEAMLEFFSATGSEKPESDLNALRTKYANKISQDVADMRPDIFCSRYAPRIVKAAQMSAQDLRDWAGTFYEGFPVSYPICAQDLQGEELGEYAMIADEYEY